MNTLSFSMDGTGEKTELSDEICNGHISSDYNGHHSNSFYMCLGCAAMWPWKKNMKPNTPHKKVVLKPEYA